MPLHSYLHSLSQPGLSEVELGYFLKSRHSSVSIFWKVKSFRRANPTSEQSDLAALVLNSPCSGCSSIKLWSWRVVLKFQIMARLLWVVLKFQIMASSIKISCSHILAALVLNSEIFCRDSPWSGCSIKLILNASLILQNYILCCSINCTLY